MSPKHICFLLAIFVLSSSCFFGGVDKKGSVLKYKSGIVYTEGGAFRIGKPSTSWMQSPFRFKAILFKNKNVPASMSVSSFCRGSFDDAPLSSLSRQAFYDMAYQKEISQNTVQVGERDALRVVKTGKLDGSWVTLDVVTLKMNGCVFDFLLSAAPDSYKQVENDFKDLYQGFQYLRGPSI